MLDFLLKVLKELLSYYPALLPCIVVFYLESCSYLKFYKAVQRLPLREDNSKVVSAADSKVVKNTWRWICLLAGIILFSLLLTSLFVVPQFLNDITQTAKLRIFYLCTLPILTSAIVPASMAILNGNVIRAIFRKGEGKPSLVMLKADGSGIASQPPAILIAIGVIVNIGAFWFQTPVALLVIYLNILHFFSSNSISVSKVKFKYLLFFAIPLGLFVIAAVLLVSIYKLHEPIPVGLHASGASDLIQWNSVLLSCTSHTLSLSILSILLRFDYAKSLPDGFEQPVIRNTPGFRIKYSMLEAFPKPYYTAAFIAFGSSFVGIAALSAAGFLICRYENVGMLVSLVAPPAMLASAFALATVKGQFKELWMYEEDWAAIPTVNQEGPVNAATKGDGQEGDMEIEKNEEKDLIDFDGSAHVGEHVV